MLRLPTARVVDGLARGRCLGVAITEPGHAVRCFPVIYSGLRAPREPAFFAAARCSATRPTRLVPANRGFAYARRADSSEPLRLPRATPASTRGPEALARLGSPLLRGALGNPPAVWLKTRGVPSADARCGQSGSAIDSVEVAMPTTTAMEQASRTQCWPLVQQTLRHRWRGAENTSSPVPTAERSLAERSASGDLEAVVLEHRAGLLGAPRTAVVRNRSHRTQRRLP
jgi:hypothetical protein